MSRSTKWLLPFSLFAMACERPTAPEAHDMARQAERRFADGDFDGIGNMFFGNTDGGVVHHLRQTDLNRAMQLSRDGRGESISGFVIEEILIASGGAGRPRVRRTLIGWPDDLAYALHATTDAAAGYNSFATDSAPRLSARSGITIRQRRARSWHGVSGSVSIGDPIIDAPCGTAKESPLRTIGMREPGTRCEFALYEVDVVGELVRSAPSDGPLRKLLERRQIVRVVQQRVPGVRFTVQCPDFKPGDRFGSESFEPHNRECGSLMHFWRHNELFAPELGVDVAQLRPAQGEGSAAWYVTPESRERVPFVGAQTLRWKIHAPDGRLLEQDSIPRGTPPPYRRDVDLWMMKSQFNRRVRALVPASDVDSTASRYAVVVLDLEYGPGTPIQRTPEYPRSPDELRP